LEIAALITFQIAVSMGFVSVSSLLLVAPILEHAMGVPYYFVIKQNNFRILLVSLFLL